MSNAAHTTTAALVSVARIPGACATAPMASVSKAFCGTLSGARKELRAQIRAGDIGAQVEPHKVSLRIWLLVGFQRERQAAAKKAGRHV